MGPAALPAWSEGYFKRPEQLPLQTAGPQVHLESRLLGLGWLVAANKTQLGLQRSAVLWGGLAGHAAWVLGHGPSLRLASIAMGHTLRGPPEFLQFFDVVLRRIKMSGGKRAKNGLHKFQLQWKKKNRNVSKHDFHGL